FNNDIVIIDKTPELVRQISDRYDIRALHGYAADPAVLEKAEAHNADLLIAVTNSDETNMIACEVARALFKIPKKIARIRNQAYLRPEYSHLFHENNISIDYIISPEVEVAKSIRRGLSVSGALSLTPMAHDKVKVIAVKCTTKT